jgi:amino acid adenylation domain-containing protein
MSSLSRLSLEERNALEERLLARGRVAPLPQRQGPMPLTPAQESLWVAEQMTPGRPLYNIPLAFRIAGPLQVALLQQSWALVFRRHQALRTRITLVEQRPLQQALDTAETPWTMEELAGRQLEKVLEGEAQKPFDLTNGSLVRCRLFTLAENEHVMALTLHHIIADNQSLGIILRELSSCYGALARGEKTGWPFAPAQFSDVARSQNEAHECGHGKEDAEFWRQRMAEAAEERLALPGNIDGDWQPIRIPAEVTAALKELARREQATLYMALLAGFGALFHRQTDRETFAVGAPVSQRDYPGAEETVGLLIHTVALRFSFQGDPNFLETLRRVKSEAITCFRHARAPGAFPPLETVFQLIDVTGPALRLAGTIVTEMPTRTGTSKFGLTVTLAELDGELRGNAEFSYAAFDRQTVERWMERYVALLTGVLKAPDRPISEIPLISETERQLVVAEWNRTETKYPREATIHALFEEQARRKPDATALFFGEQIMSYRELERRANEAAAVLRREGVGPGDAVAICLERSPDLIIGLLGILKAGAAYVPLDADYPKERLDYMLQDSGAKALIDTDGITRLEGTGAKIAQASSRAADMPAYVIYTSGSTGQPKGVVVPHRGVVRLVKETNYAAFGPDEVFLQFAPVTFDASTFEIWGALLNGATLAIYPPRFESLSQFGSILKQYGVTTLWLTAGLFHQMVENDLEALRGVRQLLAGGDVLSPTSVKTVLRALPGVRVINGYGPTENTTFSCCHTLPADWNGASVPIGRPISNSRAYIVDKKFNPVGIGMPGELCVAGDGLALGYLNSPELTAQKFVRDPFSSDPNERLYRTGDLALYHPDGTIEFLGRMDQQVKIRGFRVELGEVEEALRRHPNVAQAAALAREDATHTRQLVGYLVARPRQLIDISELRQFLRVRLPAHLVPSRFFVLDSLPLTSNGKVDRRRLPADDSVGAEQRTPPRTETERKLAGIWQELLGLKQLGVEQNFFELGGHSLLAMRLQSQVFQTLGATLPLREIFEHPTIALLADRIGRRAGQPGRAPGLIPRRTRRQTTPA